MEPEKPARKLGDTIHSLLGWKSHLTSSWVKSVCDIMKNRSSSIESKPKDKSDDESLASISKIKDELVVFTDYINHLNAQRRRILNEFLDLRGNIRVFCRIRPIAEGESFGPTQPVAALDSSNVLLKLSDNKSKTYTFDKVFSLGSLQDEVFTEVEPVIKSALDGYNACIFAYGQTGTGKSFTMEGTPNTPGVVSRAMEAIFKQASNSNHVFLFSFSMLEIYIGNLKDLLVPQPTNPMDPVPPCLSIQTDPKGGIEIDKLVVIRVTDFNQALRLYRLGCRKRSTASTNSNTTSSRSHCLIRLSITCLNAPERRRETNKIWFIDLGGSERVLKTKASGKRLDEGKAINLSLSALGDVIHALHKKNCHVPFRNSKLTQVLKDSLGEDSKTLMLVHISPKEHDICETVCSLGFATRVRSINLGNTETNEEKERREVGIMNLQGKMKMIEDEQQEIRQSIVKLNGELEKLTGEAQPPIEEPKLNDPDTEKSDPTEPKEAPTSEIPRFMKATVCSTRRKSALDYQTFEETVKRRIRRPSSHRAESVSFPVKRRSEYKSECSVSRNSCLVGLNTKSNADDQTEYSHDVTECETSSKRSSVQCKGVPGMKNSYFRSTNIKKVDNWLSLHKNEPTIGTSTISRKSKRVLAIPVLENKQTRKGERKASDKFDVPETMEYKQTRKGETEASEKLDAPETMARAESFVGEEAVKHEKRDGSFSPTEIRCGDFDSNDRSSFDSYPEENEEKKTVAMTSKAKENNTLRSSDCTSVDGDEQLCVFSCSDGLDRYNDKLVDGMFETREDSIESSSVPTEIRSYISSNKGIDTIKLMPGIHNRRAQRALFMANGNPKDIIRPQVKPAGTYHLFAERLRIAWVTALLALGFRHLGFDHEFFHGLTL